ncbi:MAG: glycosyltransferase family 1 protein [Microcystis aeruginosa Ma_QC_C_20070703_M131]|uniref:Glycosyltransferase family 1 protein n=2 Tax=Microcystis aeruginosa TaxID=1126 RepID=A0A551Y5G0_MICAE|nr:MAG: glycosyltransferase family 1 protein [Microcystis aeruginosa Ma_QC_C_20070703_M131]
MRLLRITTNYPSYLKQFYARHPELIKQAYVVQYQTMMADCYGWADFWTHAFGKLGYEVWEPVGNAEPMQKAWALENRIKFREKSWLTDIIKAQVESFCPDILFADDYGAYKADFIQQLRSCCPSVKLVLGWCGAPYANSSVFKSHDIIFSNIPDLVNLFREQGHKSEYIKHAFEPRILEKIATGRAKTIDFSFIGSINKGQSAHNQRELLIKELIQKVNLQIWSAVSYPSPAKLVLLTLRQLAYDMIDLLKQSSSSLNKSSVAAITKFKEYRTTGFSQVVDPVILKSAYPPLFGLSMFQHLHDSKVTFNNHIDISSRAASNMRLFEATGVGTCLVTDWKDNLHDLFEPDREVVTYRSPQECVEKVKWLLEHPQEREAIAQAGQARTLKYHTFDQRAIEIDYIIRRDLN